MRRGAQGQTDQDGRLSERSEFEPGPGWTEHRRLPRSEAQGTQTAGSPFFWVLFFGDAKKGASPAGARPGLQANYCIQPTRVVCKHGFRIKPGMTEPGTRPYFPIN